MVYVENEAGKNMDEKDFFREVTLRICGSLEIGTALHRCFLFIQDDIPAAAMVLSTYDPESGVSEIIAGADASGGAAISVKTVQQPAARSIIEDWYEQPDRSSHVRIIRDMSRDEAMRAVAQKFTKLDAPALHMRLKLDREMLGSLVILSEGRSGYTSNHARLISLVNEPFAIALSNYLRYRELEKLKDHLADANLYLQNELRQIAGDQIVGADFGLKGVMDLVRQVAPLGSPVLLLGETGTGKEIIANAIHNFSPRKDRAFIKVNCGAISESLLDSELFGHEKGAFTGALARKKGRFERADTGTIFLDEIGELTPGAQIRFLRVLQEKKIERLGGTEPIEVDIRVIAATHRDLGSMLSEGRFREDLYFRLRVFPIMIPPLRNRKNDIPNLVQHFMQKKARDMGLAEIPTLAPESVDRLMNYDWPGNVRELENAVERALILSQGAPLIFHDLENNRSFQTGQVLGPVERDALNLDKITARHIRGVLELTRGRVDGERGAARLLGVNPRTLRHRMKKLGVPFGRKAGHYRKTEV